MYFIISTKLQISAKSRVFRLTIAGDLTVAAVNYCRQLININRCQEIIAWNFPKFAIINYIDHNRWY